MPHGDHGQLKQTNEIGAVIPLLEQLAPGSIADKTITGDALLTQRKLAEYLINQQQAHYLFTVKDNHPGMLAALQLGFADRPAPSFRETETLAHGRIESRAIWTSCALNDYLMAEFRFPGIGQAFLIERRRTNKKTGKASVELAYGITSHAPVSASAQQLLTLNRNHWSIENRCHWVLDWNWDEDRSTIRTGHGPENTTSLRRFAIGVIRTNTSASIASTTRRLHRSPRLLFDFLRMTNNSQRATARHFQAGCG